MMKTLDLILNQTARMFIKHITWLQKELFLY